MGLSTSPEFYVNMKNPPVWNDLFGWEDQDDDVKQFFTEEAYKVKNGVTINGTFIPPWLYWHVNFFPVFQDLPNGERVPAISRLREFRGLIHAEYTLHCVQIHALLHSFCTASSRMLRTSSAVPQTWHPAAFT